MTHALLKKNGFTIIEVVVYLALFGILMGGAVTVAYNVFESSARNEARTILQIEGDFLTAKINWALSSIQAVNEPLPGNTGSRLSVAKWDPLIGTVLIDWDAAQSTMRLTRASGPAQALNNTNVAVPSLVFDHQGSLAGPEWVTAKLTLTTNTSDGKTLTQDFQTTKYLRR